MKLFSFLVTLLFVPGVGAQNSGGAAEVRVQPGTDAGSPVATTRSTTITPDSSEAMQQPNSDMHVAFRIKYVTQGAAYLEGGRN